MYVYKITSRPSAQDGKLIDRMETNKILHHDHCFDGFASAAVFSRFFVEKIEPGADLSYTGLSHTPNQKFIEEELFDGDHNVIVNFKYSPSPRLTWWFDHHQSAFLSPADERHYYDDGSPD